MIELREVLDSGKNRIRARIETRTFTPKSERFTNRAIVTFLYPKPGRAGSQWLTTPSPPGAPYIKYIQGEWGEGVREWGGAVGPGPTGPGPGQLSMGPGITWP
jgi:hypothetical protein